MPYGCPLFRRNDVVDIIEPNNAGQRLSGVVHTVNWRDCCYGGVDDNGDRLWVRDASYDVFVEYASNPTAAGADEYDAARRNLDSIDDSGSRPGVLYKNVAERFICKPGNTLPEPAVRAKQWRRNLGQSGTRDDRILFCGDIHCKIDRLGSLISEAADRVDAGTIVLLGDLLNEWNIAPENEAAAFNKLVDWVNDQRRHRNVVVLLGNHDLTYWVQSNTPDYRAFKSTCPGYNEPAYPDVHDLLHALQPQIMYGFNDAQGHRVLASHAGLTQSWWNWMADELTASNGNVPALQDSNASTIADTVNTLAQGSVGGGIRPFGIMVGRERGGSRGEEPSPVWAGKEELGRDPLHGFRQIVGHTPVETVEYRRCGIGTGKPTPSGKPSRCSRAELWYCDTHSLYRDGRSIGDDSLLLYDRASGNAWSVTAGIAKRAI
ncbi:metallophosphoesterase [Bifidobacterium imperatoris]|uniref:Metallophosphoesterase n=1 Tax=Bifidobacterium imperatoris TaxID=2020965 RepID=A0A2N5IT70_9BIFI|nr:metallophosphoesterase [Bifidobacterium imperatoris]PLS25159.1 metallophosphoesterase [Bifidobacterium imperatoris]QSY57727.1 metallophosphoesterase [Bifidobacterium imperatoris]